MELDKSNLNYQAKTQELFGENQILLHENNKLIKQRNDYKQQRDELIKDVEQQRELLIDFSRFIHRKVEACPGKPEYMDFRDRLKELGVRGRD